MRSDPQDIATDGQEAVAPEEGNGWLEDYLPYQLYRVSNLMNIRLQGRLRAMNVNLSQWRVLSVLRSHGLLSLSQIVEHTLMEQPTTSRVVAQLEQDGLVDRRISPTDSRIAHVSMSAKGLAVFNEICPAAVRHQRTALGGLEPQELKALRDALQRIENNITLDQ